MLQINTTPGLIGINTILGRQSIEQPQGELTVNQAKSQMHIDRELPQVIIDQYECFAEAGLKNNTDLRREISQLSYKCLMDSIANYNQEGDMLAQIEKPGNPLPTIAENKAFPQYEFNIDFIPKSRPKIDVTGHINISWDIHKPTINYEVRRPVVDYQPGKAEIYMRQWPRVEIRFIDEKY